MKILIVSQWFPPEPGGGPARFLEMAGVWREQGHEVRVIAGLPNWPSGKIHEAYRRRLALRERYQGVSVVRVPVIPARNEGAMRRLVNHGSFAFTASLAGMVQRFKPEVVVATSPPLFAPLAGLAAARRHRVPLVLDIRDLWPDSIWALSTRLQSAPTKRGLEWLERFLYRSADAVATISLGLAESISERGAKKVATIPNGVDLQRFAPNPPDAEARDLIGWRPDGFTVLYGGTIGLAHGLETAIEAAERLAEEGVRFVFAGDGADRKRLTQLADQKRLSNVAFLSLQPRGGMPAIYGASDACLVSLRPAPLFASALPSKIFEIMGCGRPIVAAVEGEAADVITRSGAGMVAQPGSVESMVAAVRACRASDLATMGASGRRFAEANYDRRVLALRYEELLIAAVEER